MQIAGKNIILTGASSGIGAKLLEQLSRYKEVKIIAVARRIENIPNKDGVCPFSADISTKEGVDSVFSYAQSVFGDTDIFIANAGFGYMETKESPNWKEIEDIYRLNVFSPIYSLEKLMKESKVSKAFVCNISAVAFIPLPRHSLYCSTKAALHQFIETFRYEQNKYIQITSVYPIATRTGFFNTATNTEKPYIPSPSQDAEVVAAKIIRGIEKGKRKVYTSSLFRIMHILSRLFPVVMTLYASNEKRTMSKWSRI